MLTHFSPLLSVKRNNEARVGKAGAMLRSHSEAEAGSREREAPGVALLSPQGWAPGRRAALRTRPPFRGTGLGGGGRGEGAGASAAPQRVGPSALCAQRCRCLPPGTARPHTKKPHPRACETAVPPPLPNRALPRPCSCPPAPSVPSQLPLSFPLPFPKTKECRSPPCRQPRPAPSPLRTAPQDYQFFRPDNAIHLPGSSPASLVSTHLSNSLDGTALTLRFSFSFLPPPFLSPIFFLFSFFSFLFLTREEIKDVTKHFPKCPLTPFKAYS